MSNCTESSHVLINAGATRRAFRYTLMHIGYQQRHGGRTGVKVHVRTALRRSQQIFVKSTPLSLMLLWIGRVTLVLSFFRASFHLKLQGIKEPNKQSLSLFRCLQIWVGNREFLHAFFHDLIHIECFCEMLGCQSRPAPNPRNARRLCQKLFLISFQFVRSHAVSHR